MQHSTPACPRRDATMTVNAIAWIVYEAKQMNGGNLVALAIDYQHSTLALLPTFPGLRGVSRFRWRSVPRLLLRWYDASMEILLRTNKLVRESPTDKATRQDGTKGTSNGGQIDCSNAK